MLTPLVIVLTVSSVAHAAEPESSSLVNTVEYDLPTHSVDPDDGAFLGLTECEELAERTGDIELTFKLNVDPTEKEGSVKRLEEVWLFELDPSDAEVECDSSNCIPLDEEVSTKGNDVQISLGPQTLLQGSGCDRDRDVFVRLELVEDFEEDELTSGDARVRIDVTGPDPPDIDSVEATQTFIEVELTHDEDSESESLKIGWGPSGFTATSPDELTFLGTVAADAKRAKFDDVELPTDELIQVYAWSVDDVDNAGALSEPYPIEPLPAHGYWDRYGGEEAACSSASGEAAWLPLLLLVMFVLARRFRRARRRTVASGLVAACLLIPCLLIPCLLIPGTAHADEGLLELRLGNYSPGVSNTARFAEHFGQNDRWMVGVDGGWVFAETPVAHVGVDAGLSYTALSGVALTEEGKTVDDGSSLKVVPMKLGLRALSPDEVPWLVVGVRAGLTGHYFRFGTPAGVSVAPDGAVGRGVQWGWYSSGQLGLDLTGFDRESAALMESDWAIRRTVLFVEVAYSDVDDFGRSTLQLGGAQFSAGLGFAF